MKTQAQVKSKLKDAQFKYLKRKYKSRLSKRPENCKHNLRHEGTAFDYEEGSTKPVPKDYVIGLCMYGANPPELWSGKICDTLECAQSCDVFEPKATKESLKEEFQGELENWDVLSQEYKDLAALRWVVDDGDYPTLESMSLFKKVWIRVYINFCFLTLWINSLGMF